MAKAAIRNRVLGFAKGAIASALCVIALPGCKGRENWKVVAVDESGKPVPGLKVYVTYPSVPKPPMFVTDKDGEVVLTPKSKTGIHSLSLSLGDRRLGISWRDVRWPLRVKVSGKDLEIINN